MRLACFHSFAAIALLIALLGCREGASTGATRDQGGFDGRGQNVGALQGDVFFVGVPCPLIYPPRPPCDGPFPGYEVIVLHADLVARERRARGRTAWAPTASRCRPART